jgi:hypothetical protein
MLETSLVALTCVFFASALCVTAQAKLKIFTIKSGTENMQLIPNDGFQSQGVLISGNCPRPTGSARGGDINATAVSNTVPVKLAVVAKVLVDGDAPVSSNNRMVTLEPNRPYAFSGYLWNMGDSANYVNTVMDMNHVSGEIPIQVTIPISL